MKTLNSCLVAELTDILKIMGKLNAISLELQFQNHNVLEYRYYLRKCIDLTSQAANLAEESLYPQPQSYYKSIANRNLFNSNTLVYIYDLITLTAKLKDRLSHVYLAYPERNLKLIQYFVFKLSI
jgi:hypothetical protein